MITKRIKHFDVWFKPCAKCGHDAAKCSDASKSRCLACGNRISRDYSDRALGQAYKDAIQFLETLKVLQSGYMPHKCGGFSMDDVAMQMKKPFMEKQRLYDAIEVLLAECCIVYVGACDWNEQSCFKVKK